jgi:hypothetical protein
VDRSQFIVIGIVAIAVSFFALRFLSDDETDVGFDRSSKDLAMARGRDVAVGGNPTGGLGDRPGRRLGGGGRNGSALGSRGDGSSAGGEGPVVGRSGSARTIMGGARERGGIVGKSVGEGGSRVAREVGETGLRDQRKVGGDTRGDRMGLLDGKQTKIDPFYEGAAEDENPDDDVVLEVKDVNDTDRKAAEVEGVDETEDGVGLDIGEDSVLKFPNAGNANADHGSIAFEIKPAWDGADQSDNSFMQLRTEHQWDNRMQLVKNGSYLRFILTDNTGHEADISYKIDHWEEGENHSVTATYGDGQTSLYVDGRRVGTNEYPGGFEIPPDTPMYFGSDLPDGSYRGANASFRNIKVYNRALESGEIY